MDGASLVAIFIAVVGAFGSWAAHRAASKAAEKNTAANNRVEMEKEAYERARKLDVETIDRQDSELLELLQKNRDLMARNEELGNQVQELQARVARLEARIRHMEEGKNGQH